MVIDFRKLKKATKKDHYPLPFIDQMLERLSKHTHFCFLDCYSSFSQIPVTTRKMLIDRSLPVAFVYNPTLLVVSSSAGYKERYRYQLAAALVT